MCDLFSWVKDSNGKIWFNRDEDIEIAGMDFDDGIGHSAIEKIWKVTGEHVEGVLRVPSEIAAAVNRGECGKMIRSARWAGMRYTKAGNINVPWWPKKTIEAAKKLAYFDNHADPLPEWKVLDTRAAARAAAGDAAWAAARAAARAAAGDAAGAAAGDAAGAAAGDAARAAAGAAAWAAAGAAAGDAAGAAARAAAGAAARAAAGAAAGDAARAAAGAAALLARCELAFTEDKTNSHLLHARKRWEVYERGYGLMCDVEGIFYVYRKP